MTTTEQLQAVMIKRASRAWARALAEGLSDSSRETLRKFLPEGVTGSVGAATRKNWGTDLHPFINNGQESKVFRSFSGGVGPTVAKRYVPAEPNFTVSQPSRDARVAVMQAHPDDMARVIKQTPAGMITERLNEIGEDNPTLAAVRDLLLKKRPYNDLRQDFVRFKQRRFGVTPEQLAGKRQLAVDARQAFYQARQNPLLQNLPSSLRPGSGGFGQLAPWGSVIGPRNNRTYGPRVSDYGISVHGEPHNIMERPGGKWVISDPAVWFNHEGQEFRPWSNPTETPWSQKAVPPAPLGDESFWPTRAPRSATSFLQPATSASTTPAPEAPRASVSYAQPPGLDRSRRRERGEQASAGVTAEPWSQL